VSEPEHILKGVQLPAADLTKCLHLYEDLLGKVDTRDGDRWATMTVDGIRVSFASGAESVGQRMSLVVKTSDVHASIATAVTAGAKVVLPAQQGPHEIRGVVRDIDGNEIVFYQSRQDLVKE
jgi:predicted enzyme related to lactoylglutathione lyase